MTNTVNPQDPTLLFAHTEYNRTQWPYSHKTIPVHKGDQVPLGYLHAGTQFELDGQRGVVMASHSKNTLVRFHETQDCVMVPNIVTITALSYGGWNEAGQPHVGQFVQVRKGEHKDRVGMVFTEGLNSTYVVFPGDRDRGLKFSARDLIIREDVTILKTY